MSSLEKAAPPLSSAANRIFGFPHDDVDFFLPQLVHLYVQQRELAEVLHPYFMARARTSVEFSIRLVWLLEAFAESSRVRRAQKMRRHRAEKLHEMLVKEEIR